MAFGKGGGSSLLDAIGMKPKKKSFFGDKMGGDEKEPSEESSPDLGGAEEEEDTGAMDMALDDFADALGLDGDKREEAISALKQAISACVNGGGGEEGGI